MSSDSYKNNQSNNKEKENSYSSNTNQDQNAKLKSNLNSESNSNPQSTTDQNQDKNNNDIYDKNVTLESVNNVKNNTKNNNDLQNSKMTEEEPNSSFKYDSKDGIKNLIPSKTTSTAQLTKSSNMVNHEDPEIEDSVEEDPVIEDSVEDDDDTNNAKQSIESIKKSQVSKTINSEKRINVKEIKKIISDQSNAIEQLKDQDVVILLHNTGNGGTTTLLKLEGYKFKKIKKDNKQIQKCTDKQIEEKQKQGHTNESTTINFNVVKSEKFNTWLVDPIGYKDNRSHDYDIVNYCIFNRIKSIAKSLKFIQLIDYNSIGVDRGDPFQSTLEQVTQSFSIDDYCSILFIFTHIGDEQKTNLSLKEGIQQIENGLRDFVDPKEKNSQILKFMKFNIKDNITQLNPEQSNIENIWKKINKLSSITSGSYKPQIDIKILNQLVNEFDNVKKEINTIIMLKNISLTNGQSNLKIYYEIFNFFSKYIDQVKLNDLQINFKAEIVNDFKDILENSIRYILKNDFITNFEFIEQVKYSIIDQSINEFHTNFINDVQKQFKDKTIQQKFENIEKIQVILQYNIPSFARLEPSQEILLHFQKSFSQLKEIIINTISIEFDLNFNNAQDENNKLSKRIEQFDKSIQINLINTETPKKINNEQLFIMIKKELSDYQNCIVKVNGEQTLELISSLIELNYTKYETINDVIPKLNQIEQINENLNFINNQIRILSSSNSQILNKSINNLLELKNEIKEHNNNDFQYIEMKIGEIIKSLKNQQKQYKLELESLTNDNIIQVINDLEKQNQFKKIINQINIISEINILNAENSNGSIILNNMYQKIINQIADPYFKTEKYKEQTNLIKFYLKQTRKDFKEVKFMDLNKLTEIIKESFENTKLAINDKINKIQGINFKSRYQYIKSDEFMETIQEFTKQSNIFSKNYKSDFEDLIARFQKIMNIDQNLIQFREDNIYLTEAELETKFNIIDLIKNVPNLGFMSNEEISNLKDNFKNQFDNIKLKIKIYWDNNKIDNFKKQLETIKNLIRFDKYYEIKNIQDIHQCNYEKIYNNIDKDTMELAESENWEKLSDLISKIDLSNQDLKRTQDTVITFLQNKINPLHKIFYDELCDDHIISLKKLAKMRCLSEHIPDYNKTQDEFKLSINKSILNILKNLKDCYEFKNDNLWSNQLSFMMIENFRKIHNQEFSREIDDRIMEIKEKDKEFCQQMKEYPDFLEESLKNDGLIQNEKEFNGICIKKFNKLISVCNKINNQQNLVQEIKFKFNDIQNNQFSLIETESNNLLFKQSQDLYQVVQNKLYLKIPNLEIDLNQKFKAIYEAIEKSEMKFKNEKSTAQLSTREIDGLQKSMPQIYVEFIYQETIDDLNQRLYKQIVSTIQTIENEQYKSMNDFMRSTVQVQDKLLKQIYPKNMDGFDIRNKFDYIDLVDSKLLKNIENYLKNTKNNLRNNDFKGFLYWFKKIMEYSKFNWSQFQSVQQFNSDIFAIFKDFIKSQDVAINENDSKTVIEKYSFQIELAEFSQKELNEQYNIMQRKELRDNNRKIQQIDMKDIKQITLIFPKKSQIEDKLKKQLSKLENIILDCENLQQYEKIYDIYKLLLDNQQDNNINEMKDNNKNKYQKQNNDEFKNKKENLLKFIKDKILGRIQNLQSEIPINLSTENLKEVDSQIQQIENISNIFSEIEGIINIDQKKNINLLIIEQINNTFEKLKFIAEKQNSNENSKIISFEIIQNLIKLGRIQQYLNKQQEESKRNIDLSLGIIQIQGQTKVNEIGILMEQKEKDENTNEEEQKILRDILSNFKQFKDINIISWNNNITTMRSKDIVSQDNLQIKDMQKELLNFDHKDRIEELLLEFENYQTLIKRSTIRQTIRHPLI